MLLTAMASQFVSCVAFFLLGSVGVYHVHTCQVITTRYVTKVQSATTVI